MRKYSFFLLLGLIASLFVGCDGKNLENPYRPGFKVRILKISNTEYMNNVLACYEDLTNYQICTTEWLHCEDLFLGTSPYIHLADNYYLLDWKWDLHLCPECVLLPCKWNEVSNRYQTWKREGGSIASITEFVDEILYTSREEIDQYLEITPAPASKEWWSESKRYPSLSADHEIPWFPKDSYTTVASLPDTLYNKEYVYTKKDFFAEVERQDSLQKVYVERLKSIMQETKLSLFVRDIINL